MKEDLIERLTSMVFQEPCLSQIVLRLFQEITAEQNAKYLQRLNELEGLKPANVGLSSYLTLDGDSNIEQLHSNFSAVGDMGGSPSESVIGDDWNIISSTVTRKEIKSRLAKNPYSCAIK